MESLSSGQVVKSAGKGRIQRPVGTEIVNLTGFYYGVQSRCTEGALVGLFRPARRFRIDPVE